MKLGTVSLWCLCCGREMRYYNFISVVVIFPLKKKSVFLLSWTGPVKPALFFERSFFRQKSPGSPDGPHKKLSWKHGFVNQFTTSWKAFPPHMVFLKPIVCSVCSSILVRLSFPGRVWFCDFCWPETYCVTETWCVLTFSLFSGGRWNSHPALLPLSYMCLKIPPLLLDVNPQKSFPISVNFFVPQEYCFHS